MINKTALNTNSKINQMPIKRSLVALLDILVAFTPVAIFAYIGDRIGLTTILSGVVITVGYVLTTITATRILKLRSTGWHENGLARPKNWPKTVLLGLAAFIGTIVVYMITTDIATNLPWVEIPPVDITRFNPLVGNLPLMIFYVILAWTLIAFPEEMFFRAFLTNRLAEIFHNSKLGTVVAVLGSAAAFGIVHYGEGPLGFYVQGAVGLLFSIIYLRSGRNLWITLIAHALMNTLRFIFVYSGAV